MPKRIQRKRIKGYKMPKGAVYVGRPGIYGNPFPVDIYGDKAVDLFRRWVKREMSARELSEHSHLTHSLTHSRTVLLANLRELRGKDLACWCPIGSPCHADILLEMANR